MGGGGQPGAGGQTRDVRLHVCHAATVHASLLGREYVEVVLDAPATKAWHEPAGALVAHGARSRGPGMVEKPLGPRPRVGRHWALEEGEDVGEAGAQLAHQAIAESAGGGGRGRGASIVSF